jgi:hypothetical protein
MTRDRTRSSAVTDRRLSALVMAQPSQLSNSADAKVMMYWINNYDSSIHCLALKKLFRTYIHQWVINNLDEAKPSHTKNNECVRLCKGENIT